MYTFRRLVPTVVVAFTASGCFTTTADFKTDAERFIETAVAADPGIDTTFEQVSCEEPLNQDVGTRFTCQAIDVDGGIWEFDNVIDAEGQFTVNVAERP